MPIQAYAQLINIQLKVVEDRYFDFLPFILQVLLLLNNHNIGKIGWPMTLCPSRFFQFLFTLRVIHGYIHLPYLVWLNHSTVLFVLISWLLNIIIYFDWLEQFIVWSFKKFMSTGFEFQFSSIACICIINFILCYWL